MNCYGAKEIAASYRTVRKNTVVIAEDISEELYSFTPAPGTRTVAQTLSHIALTTRMPLQIHAIERRTTLEGFDFPAFFVKLSAEEQAPRSKSEILATLREEGERFAKWVDGLSDDFLAERVTFPAGMLPPTKTRFEMIMAVKEHEMHHRGQLMLLERMIGIVPHMTRDMQARMAAMQAVKASA